MSESPARSEGFLSLVSYSVNDGYWIKLGVSNSESRVHYSKDTMDAQMQNTHSRAPELGDPEFWTWATVMLWTLRDTLTE